MGGGETGRGCLRGNSVAFLQAVFMRENATIALAVVYVADLRDAKWAVVRCHSLLETAYFLGRRNMFRAHLGAVLGAF